MKRPLLIFVVFASALIALLVAAFWPRDYMGSRDIGCAELGSGRSRHICNTIADSMEWTWMGHAIISPGYRLTWNGLGRVYCRAGITPSDIPALEAMKRSSDWRLRLGAEELIHLVNSTNSKETFPENSIFNPSNPDYILRHGCAVYESK